MLHFDDTNAGEVEAAEEGEAAAGDEDSPDVVDDDLQQAGISISYDSGKKKSKFIF